MVSHWIYAYVGIDIDTMLDHEYPRGLMFKTQGCRIVVNEFKLQPSYYVYFRTNTVRKDINTLFLLANG